MDSPTQAASITELKPGESREVELFASFNQEVFRTEGVTPLTGEVIVSYKSKGRAAEQRQSVSYDLHDKTAVTWDDDQKVAAFITPADSALRNYASFIRQACKEQTIPTFNDPLQLAMQVFHALGEIGCLYQADPSLPFTKVQDNPMVVDSISLPRDTLKRITGRLRRPDRAVLQPARDRRHRDGVHHRAGAHLRGLQHQGGRRGTTPSCIPIGR